jgi:site-specific DNA recombinase
MQNVKRAVIYARYSSENQRDASIDDQARLCTTFVERQGWQVVATYSDHALSGASSLRPGYQKLLEDGRNGCFDIVVAEALDRISRDQADTATFYKLLSFAGVCIVTVAEGEISELHVGLKGTMNALYLKDLAQKTRRGLAGRVRQGRSAGGLCYGYDVVREIGSDGERVFGKRSVNAAEATVVRRIFAEFVKGRSPRAIAAGLNRSGIAGPRDTSWSMSTIYGNWRRGTGILNNELYVGRLIWNRQRFIKDPATGKRQARRNPEADWITEDVPDLRIVEEDLWQDVKARQKAIRSLVTAVQADCHHPERARRARYLFSGLITCGPCGGGYTLVSALHYGCANARNRGTCANRLTIRRDVLEASVLNGLKEHLLRPDLVKEFMQEYQREYNRRAAEVGITRAARVQEIEKLKRQIREIIEAIKAGLRSASLASELDRLELRREVLEQESASRPELPVRLHPRLADVYRRKVADLADALNAEANRDEAAEILRSLIDGIRLIPEEGTLAVELVGALAGILALTQKRPPGRTRGAQTTMVAGIGFEPMTFRL